MWQEMFAVCLVFVALVIWGACRNSAQREKELTTTRSTKTAQKTSAEVAIKAIRHEGKRHGK